MGEPLTPPNSSLRRERSWLFPHPPAWRGDASCRRLCWWWCCGWVLENGLREQDGEHFGAVKVKDDTPQSTELLLLVVVAKIIIILRILLANDDVDTRAEIIFILVLWLLLLTLLNFSATYQPRKNMYGTPWQRQRYDKRERWFTRISSASNVVVNWNLFYTWKAGLAAIFTEYSTVTLSGLDLTWLPWAGPKLSFQNCCVWHIPSGFFAMFSCTTQHTV